MASLGLRSRTPINRFGLLITTRGEQPPCVRANGSPLLALRPCPFRSQNNVRAPASFGGGSIDHGQLILGWDLQRRTGRHLLQNLLHLAIRARIVQDGETRRTESCALLRTHRAGRAGSKIGTRFRIIGIPRQRPAPWHSASGQAPPWRELVSSCRSGLKRLAIVKPSTSKKTEIKGALAIERGRIRVGIGTWVHHFVLMTCPCRHFGIRRDTGKDSFVTPHPSSPVLDLL